MDIWNMFYTGILVPIANAFMGFWNGVAVPLWESLVSWVSKYLPFCTKFADFCTKLFRLRYQARIYSFMLMVPIALLAVLAALVGRRRQNARKRRLQKKAGHGSRA